MSIAYVIGQNETINLFLNGKTFVVGRDHMNYGAIVDALNELEGADLECEIEALLNIAQSVENYTDGRITIKDNVIFFNGKELHNTMATRLQAILSKGLPWKNMVKFLDNLMDNPSARAVNELYDFLSNKGLPITEDGCFLAYKAVDKDFFDKYSHTIENKVGTVVNITRNEVDDNRDHECSYGLHVGALDYVRSYGLKCAGDNFIIVKVNPRDVVSVPRDCNAQKCRVCEYRIIDTFDGDTLMQGDLYTADGQRVDYDDFSDYERDIDEDYRKIDGDDICDECGEYYDECLCDSNEYNDDKMPF